MHAFRLKVVTSLCWFTVVNCEWAEWEEWQSCNPSCGDGTQTRTRTKAETAQHGGTDCDGSDTDTQDCNAKPCPSEYMFSPNHDSAFVTINDISWKVYTHV